MTIVIRKTIFIIITIITCNSNYAQKLIKATKGANSNKIAYNYNYDENKSISNEQSTYPQTFRYIYTKDSIFKIIETDTSVIKLKNGLAYLFYEKSNPKNFESLKYNEKGYLVNKYVKTDYGSYYYSTETNYFYQNDNLVRLTERQYNAFSGGAPPYDHTNTIIYEYFLDKKNTLGNENEGKKFLGKSSKNLVKSLVVNGRKSDYLYEFYEDGTIKKRSLMQNGKVEEITFFEYY